LNYGQMARDDQVSQTIGYAYEPGSTCQHTWYMSPGGSRTDRSCWPDVVVRWATAPNGVRPHGALSHKEAIHHWMKGYHNEGMHFFTNLERGTSIQVSKLKIGNLCYQQAYYSGGNEDYTFDLPHSALDLFSTPRASSENPYIDKNGRNPGNDWQRDDQHNHSQAACGLYLTNSAMHAYEAKNSYDAAMAAGFGMSQGSFGGADTFLTRQHAWYMWNQANMWNKHGKRIYILATTPCTHNGIRVLVLVLKHYAVLATGAMLSMLMTSC
jgi:hypothetical protein